MEAALSCAICQVFVKSSWVAPDRRRCQRSLKRAPVLLSKKTRYRQKRGARLRVLFEGHDRHYRLRLGHVDDVTALDLGVRA